jgi:toxin ParE1/3/4
MARRILKREAAARDLTAQWVWYAENATIDVADRYLAAVDETLQLLATHPEAGYELTSPKAELTGIRRFSAGGGFEKTLLFYFPLEDGIDLVRVLHGSRDLDALFFSS